MVVHSPLLNLEVRMERRAHRFTARILAVAVLGRLPSPPQEPMMDHADAMALFYGPVALETDLIFVPECHLLPHICP